MSRRRVAPAPPLSGAACRAARAAAGWSVADLARETGVSTSTIERLEAGVGRRGPKPETVARILEAFRRAGVEVLEDGRTVRVPERPPVPPKARARRRRMQVA